MTPKNVQSSVRFSIFAVLSAIATIMPMTAWAQGSATFEDVKEQSIRIQDVPKPEESVLPKNLSETTELPRVTKLETLKATREHVAQNVFVIHVREKPISSMQRHATIATGHAVWIDNAGTAMLLTNASWVDEAPEIYMDIKAKKPDSLKAEMRTLSRQSYGKDATKRFKKDPKRYVPMETGLIDKNRNLAVLIPKAKFKAPTGLSLFPVETEAANRTFGFSPLMGSVLVEALFFAPSDDLSIAYYMQTNFRGKLGAPIVDAAGRLVAITAFSHPKDEDRVMVIPPVALRVFLDKAAGKTNADKKR